MRNISLSQIANDLRVGCLGCCQIDGYAIDSRNVQEGDLFFALPGQKTDGHRFLQDVKRRGGRAAVVASSYAGDDFGLILLRVSDVESALQQLARAHLAKTSPRIIGITGSVGKTTTKEFTATLLEGKYRIFKNPGNYNTELTLPLTILNSKGDEEILVLEMGLRCAGDLRRLVEIAAPDVAIVTKVALAHAEFFPGGIPEITQNKMEIASHPKTKTVILDRAISYDGHAEKISFSVENREADFFIARLPFAFALYEKRCLRRLFSLPFQTDPMIHNFLAASLAALQMGMTWEEILERASLLQLPPMRLTCLTKEGVVFINDAYNANPASMKAALCSLPPPQKQGKTIAVLGAMKELGHFSLCAHQEMGLLAAERVDCVLTLGEEMKDFCQAFNEKKKSAEWFLDHASLALRLKELLRCGDVVLVKGSRSMQMEKVLECF